MKKAALFLIAGMVPSFVLADTVEINAHGGVIPNDATANVKIVAGGTEGDVTLANATGTTQAGTLQTATAATVKLAEGQNLGLESSFPVKVISSNSDISLHASGSSANLSLVGEGDSVISMPANARADNGGWLRFSGVNIPTRANNSLTQILNGGTDGNRGNVSFSNGVFCVTLTQSSGICEIHDGVIMTNRVSLGSSIASVYQDGGDVYTLSFRSSDPGPGTGYAYFGNGGYLYYNFSGGTLKQRDAVRFGSKETGGTKPTADALYEAIVVEQTGGYFCNASIDFPYGSYQKAQWLMSRGMSGGPDSGSLALGGQGPGSSSVYAIDGNCATSQWRYVKSGNATDAHTVIAMNNGGVLRFGSVTHVGAEGSKTYLSFNGGTAKTVSCLGQGGLFARSWQSGKTGWDNPMTRVTVYEKGMTVDTAEQSRSLYDDLKAPSGGGVSGAASLPMANSFAGPPVVQIIGDGYGAAAIAQYDRATKKVTGLKVVSPGNDYTWAKAVYIRGRMHENNHQAETQDCTVVSQQLGGGLTKIGANTLDIYSTNTYAGATTILGGTIRPRVKEAIPAGSVIYVGENAMLDVKDIASGKNNPAVLTLGSGAGEIQRGAVRHVGQWLAKADDLVAGNVLGVTEGSLGSANAGSLAIADGATFTVDDRTKLSMGTAYTIVRTTYPITGELPTVTDMPGWNLKFSADKKSIVLRKTRGLCVIVY